MICECGRKTRLHVDKWLRVYLRSLIVEFKLEDLDPDPELCVWNWVVI